MVQRGPLIHVIAGEIAQLSPDHVAPQTRQDVGEVYAALFGTNALLAGMLTVLVEGMLVK